MSLSHSLCTLFKHAWISQSQSFLEKAKWFDWLNKKKAVKASKLSQSETNETFCEFAEEMLFLRPKTRFLKVKSAFKSSQIEAHENLDVISMTI